jgi:hypothetical protein
VLKKWMWLSFGLCVSCLLSSGLDSVAKAQSIRELGENHPLMKQLQADLAPFKMRMDVIQQQKAEIDSNIGKLEFEIEKLGAELQFDHVSEVSYPEILMQLQVQRINLSIEKAGLDAKADKLADLVNRPNEEAPNVQDQMKREKLMELLNLEKEALSRANELSKSGVIPMSEISEIRRRVIQAELQLLDLDSPQQPQTPETIWAAELLSKIALDRIEVAAKLSKIDELMGPMQQLRSTLSALQRKKKEMEPWVVKKAALEAQQAQLQTVMLEIESNFQLAPSRSNDH